MKLSRASWPVLVERLVDGFIEVARQHGVHGRVSVTEVDSAGERHYVIAVRVPASETAAARAMAPKR